MPPLDTDSGASCITLVHHFGPITGDPVAADQRRSASRFAPGSSERADGPGDHSARVRAMRSSAWSWCAR